MKLNYRKINFFISVILVFIIGWLAGVLLNRRSFNNSNGNRNFTNFNVNNIKGDNNFVYVSNVFYDTLSDSTKRRLRTNPFVYAISRVRDAVVSVSVTRVEYYRYSLDPFFEMFFPEFSQKIPMKISSMGSGFIVDEKGYILTNAHVVEDAEEIFVNMADGRQFTAKLVGVDETSDIAVLKIDGKNLPVAPLGKSDDLMIGEYVIAIGNPFGYILSNSGPTVTCGWVSAVNRNIKFKESGRYYKNMIQTNAAINQGNSGGPLVNILGEVIGVNTFILTQGNSGFIGLGFALPIDKAKKVFREIVKYGRVRNFWTGIYIQDLSPMIAEYFNLSNLNGVIVVDVEKGSPADKAGIKKKDIIVGINGRKVMDKNAVLDEISYYQVGDIIEFNIIRNKKKITIEMKLEEVPEKKIKKIF